MHDPHGVDPDATPTSIRLASGLLFDLAKPDLSKVLLSDIATSLSRQERFTGHAPLRPTVAQHSLAVEWIVGELLREQDVAHPWVAPATMPDCAPARLGRAVRRAALLHDATETYCSDVSAPAKRAMRACAVDGGSAFDAIEAALVLVIAEALHCAVPEGFDGLIHQADVLAYEYESGWGGWGSVRAPAWVEQSPYVRRCYDGGHDSPGDGGEAAFLARAERLGIR